MGRVLVESFDIPKIIDDKSNNNSRKSSGSHVSQYPYISRSNETPVYNDLSRRSSQPYGSFSRHHSFSSASSANRQYTHAHIRPSRSSSLSSNNITTNNNHNLSLHSSDKRNSITRSSISSIYGPANRRPSISLPRHNSYSGGTTINISYDSNVFDDDREDFDTDSEEDEEEEEEYGVAVIHNNDILEEEDESEESGEEQTYPLSRSVNNYRQPTISNLTSAIQSGLLEFNVEESEPYDEDGVENEEENDQINDYYDDDDGSESEYIATSITSSSAYGSHHEHSKDNTIIYRCKTCYSDICISSLIISRDFWGNKGEAYFVSDVLNVREDPKEVMKNMRTGQYGVKTIYCVQCDTTIGWKYITSVSLDEQYKVGKYVIEKNLLKTYNVPTATSG